MTNTEFKYLEAVANFEAALKAQDLQWIRRAEKALTTATKRVVK